MDVLRSLIITSLLFNLFSLGLGHVVQNSGQYPLVVSTWPFVEAVRAAWKAAENGLSAVDSVVEGCSACEELRCDGTVGPGGSPDENGETTIDAMIMDGTTMEVGAVAAMRYVKDGIKAAKLVIKHTEHTLLVGEKASTFAISMGLPGPTNLSSVESTEKWIKWKENDCQPNFWKNVLPANSCGPYHPKDLPFSMEGAFYRGSLGIIPSTSSHINYHNHDTISMAVVDHMGHIAVGTSTNGATFKIPGRVGDGPIAGSSAYADTDVGACGATGDGDIMMRFLPCYQVVESMMLGMEPKVAAKDAIMRIARKYPNFVGALFAVDKNGVHAGACHGWTFQYSVRSQGMEDVQVFTVVWYVEGLPMRVMTWSPGFDPESVNKSAAYIWIYLPRMKPQFWDTEILMSIEKAIGTPIGLDKRTEERAYRHFAAVLVEVDMAKDLPDKILVEIDGIGSFIQEIDNGKFRNIIPTVE